MESAYDPMAAVSILHDNMFWQKAFHLVVHVKRHVVHVK